MVAAPVFLGSGAAGAFPDPTGYDAEGLVAYGGDLSVARLVDAYSRGIFPWYDEGYVPIWWSPDPRGVFEPGAVKVSRSLAKVLRRGGFRLSWNTCFERVMRACGEQRDTGTWIIEEMVQAYVALHEAGAAHSLEVWIGEELVAGSYGVQVGGLFAAESKFHRRRDFSKVALVALVRSLFAAGIELFDVQFVTDHLRSLGAQEVPRGEYLRRLAVARERTVDLGDLVPSLS